ncbi:c-type cytochrome [Herbaspirillum seropedicae]|nr:c-type cytochrome [Herbaspirillum sp. alder98]
MTSTSATRLERLMPALCHGWLLALWGVVLMLACHVAQAQNSDQRVPAMAERVAACTACHGAEGRAGPDGYYPRIAGKPEAYLYNQLRNFRDGRRRYPPMNYLLTNLSDDYLRQIARHFAEQHPPYSTPSAANSSAATLERGRLLALQGAPQRRLPACAACHGQALSGLQPATPGLLGLPRDYISAQLGAWRNGARRAHAPDCMADVAQALTPDDINAVSTWLASQPPSTAPPPDQPAAPWPVPCGSMGAAP